MVPSITPRGTFLRTLGGRGKHGNGIVRTRITVSINHSKDHTLVTDTHLTHNLLVDRVFTFSTFKVDLAPHFNHGETYSLKLY